MNTKVIEVNPDTVTVDYTLPLPVDKDRTSSKEVLYINRIGSTHWKHSELLFEKTHLVLALQRSGMLRQHIVNFEFNLNKAQWLGYKEV